MDEIKFKVKESGNIYKVIGVSYSEKNYVIKRIDSNINSTSNIGKKVLREGLRLGIYEDLNIKKEKIKLKFLNK